MYVLKAFHFMSLIALGTEIFLSGHIEVVGLNRLAFVHCANNKGKLNIQQSGVHG